MMHSKKKSQYITHSTEETEQLGYRLGQALHGGEVVALFGGMGMGKTALTRGIVAGLSSTDRVSSPTFALVHTYQGRYTIHHFDFYRIQDAEDLYSTGYYDYLDYGDVLILEWSERIADAVPADAIRILLASGATEEERTITIEGVTL